MDRLIEIRKYRRLTQEEVANWFGMSKQGWQKKEAGKITGFDLHDIGLFLEKTGIDARYLFGKINRIEDADLLSQRNKSINYEDLYQKINDLENKILPVKDKDPIAYRVSINEPLRKLVSKIQYLDAHMIEKVDVLITGFLAAQTDNQEVKESAAG